MRFAPVWVCGCVVCEDGVFEGRGDAGMGIGVREGVRGGEGKRLE